MNQPPKSLRARWVFPVAKMPIADGVVTIQGERILAVGKEAPRGDVENLGNVALLPGLVNAHTHLDLSDVREPLGSPGMAFVGWLRAVIDYRLVTPVSPRAVPVGLRESLRQGTTAIGDISQTEPPDRQGEQPGPDVTSFLELIAPTPSRIASQLARAQQHIQAAGGSGAWHAGLSPHAPYSVHPDLLSAVVALSVRRHVPIAMHLAESREELALIEHHGGAFRDFLGQLGAWTPELCPTELRPLDYLHQLALAHRALVIHGNYLDDEEIGFVASRADRMAVVYCPRTHAYFQHDAYPLEKMLASGALVALGTDSRASSPDLSVLAEMRLAARLHPAVGRDTILAMGTSCGAAALGQGHVFGTIEPGGQADLVAVSLPDRVAGDPHELLLASDEPVVATWCRGVRWTASGKQRGTY